MSPCFDHCGVLNRYSRQERFSFLSRVSRLCPFDSMRVDVNLEVWNWNKTTLCMFIVVKEHVTSLLWILIGNRQQRRKRKKSHRQTLTVVPGSVLHGICFNVNICECPLFSIFYVNPLEYKIFICQLLTKYTNTNTYEEKQKFVKTWREIYANALSCMLHSVTGLWGLCLIRKPLFPTIVDLGIHFCQSFIWTFFFFFSALSHIIQLFGRSRSLHHNYTTSFCFAHPETGCLPQSFLEY